METFAPILSPKLLVLVPENATWLAVWLAIVTSPMK